MLHLLLISSCPRLSLVLCSIVLSSNPVPREAEKLSHASVQPLREIYVVLSGPIKPVKACPVEHTTMSNAMSEDSRQETSVNGLRQRAIPQQQDADKARDADSSPYNSYTDLGNSKEKKGQAIGRTPDGTSQLSIQPFLRLNVACSTFSLTQTPSPRFTHGCLE